MKRKNKEPIQPKKQSNLRILKSFLRGSIHLFLISIFASLIVTLANMVFPKIIGVTVDSVIGTEPITSPFIQRIVDFFGGVEFLKTRLWIPALCVLATGLVAALFRFINMHFNGKGAERLMRTMRNDLYGKIQRLPYRWFTQNQTGDIIQRCTSDTETVRQFISEQLTSLMRVFILIFFIMLFMFSVNTTLAIVALASIPVVVGGSMFFYGKASKYFTQCDENEGKLSAMAQENLTGVRVIRAFGQENKERERFERQNVYYTGLWIRLSKLLSAFWAYGDFITALQVMLIVVLGAVECVNGNLTTGGFITAISYNAMLIWPVRSLGRMLSGMSKAGVSVKRIAYIMNSEEEKDKPGAVDTDMRGDIEFSHVSFAYDETPVLQDVSFRIPSGSVFGILGGTGSGKSTITLLLTKLYNLKPDSGEITVGGVNVADIRMESLRKNTGIVLQEPFLFSRTLAENIGITREEYSMTDISAASDAACLSSAVAEFTKGYDTVVGERGVTLSGGQKQRAAIARILLQKTPVMIFDDSLSAVDAETDKAIRKSLKENFPGSTVILVSHRITTLMDADDVIVLENGRIAEEGNHEQLLAKKGIYAHVYALQTGKTEVI